MYRTTLTISLSIIALACLVFTGFALTKQLFPGDLFLSQSIQSIISAPLTSAMIWVSWPFDVWRAAGLTTVATILMWKFMGKLEAVMIAVAGGTTLFNYFFKFLAGRPRPSPDQVQILVQEHNNGFPSSHAFFAVVFLGMLAYLLYAHYKWKCKHFLLIAIPAVLVLLEGFSRVYLGAHWTSDVVGGYLFGGLFLILLIFIYRLRKSGSARPED